MELEVNQGKNIMEVAAVVLLEGSPLESFVLSTLSHASRWSNGEIKHLLHFDSKAIVENYLREQHPKLVAITRYLQCGFYILNVVEFPFPLLRKCADGVYEFHWVNISQSTVLTATLPGRDVEVFVHALVFAPPGTVLLGESDPMTVDEFIQTWSAVTGHPARLYPIGIEEFTAIVEPIIPGFGEEFAENFQCYRDFTYTGGDPNVSRPEDLGIDAARLTRFNKFLAEQDRNSLLQ
jgi:hypothetical protein